MRNFCKANAGDRPHTAIVSTHSPDRARPANRLAREKSPYLLQHAWNPVDWRAWGGEAFQAARDGHKPIFLSIGYSTCHWCHVMERESFENHAVAAFLNAHFISIKVDREERPDVDKIYMTFVQSTVGQGGWPLSVFLTPERKPFYGGTYFPPDDRHGRPGFLSVLQQIQEIWTNRREEITGSATELLRRLEIATAREGIPDLALSPAVLRQAAAKFKEEYDPRNGGFGGAPKFPRPSQPAFLLRHGVQYGDASAVQMVLRTCDAMAAGGICDQLGGGFARYAVDAQWLVPHFEKMLYDNAQLIPLYLDAFLVTGQARFANVARDIVQYVLRDMTHPAGGFYSAEDADSEGKEGKFYCWTKAELRALLSAEEFEVAVRHFGVTDRGNFIDHSDPEPLPHQNVLSSVDPELTDDEAARLAAAKAKLLAARARRVRPHLDDKVLSSWNGLMLGALARAYVVLGDDASRQAAERNLGFLRAKLWDPDTKTLFHRWRDGARDQVQLLEAYAFLLAGVIDLYEATLEPEGLEFAVNLAEAMLSRFYDPQNGGFWQSAEAASDLVLRLKEDYDGAEPSGNSVATLSLLRLASICGRPDFREAAEKTLRLFADRLQQVPQAVPFLLQGLAFWLTEPHRVVITGNPAGAEVRQLLRVAHGVFQPHKIVLGTDGFVEPFARSLATPGETGRAFVCLGSACQPPTTDPEKIKALLVS